MRQYIVWVLRFERVPLFDSYITLTVTVILHLYRPLDVSSPVLQLFCSSRIRILLFWSDKNSFLLKSNTNSAGLLLLLLVIHPVSDPFIRSCFQTQLSQSEKPALER
jgi:hypothetical protein